MTLANDSHSQLEIVSVVDYIFLYLVNFQTHEKEVDMSAKVAISRTDRTAGDLKAMAKKASAKTIGGDCGRLRGSWPARRRGARSRSGPGSTFKPCATGCAGATRKERTD